MGSGNINTPSLKTIRELLKLDLIQAKKIKASMENESNPIKTLNLANYFMNGFGVENLYPEYPNFNYVNMGDTYSTTLCYTGERFIVSSWGDYVEMREKYHRRE